MFNALELLLIVLALAVMAVGLSRRRHRPETNRQADWSFYLKAALGQKKILTRPLVGLAHLLLVWGFIVFILIVMVVQTPLTLSPAGAATVSLLLDMVGLLMLAATLFLLLRRIWRRINQSDLRPPKRTLAPLVLLLIIVISGFFAEGARLNLVGSQTMLAAPVGSLCALFLPEAPGFMQAMLRVHFVFVILFFITLPFTFMRHLGTTALHLLYREKTPPQLPGPVCLATGPLGAATVADFSPAQRQEAEACVSCGRCDEQCPALISGKPLSPRAVMGKIMDQIDVGRCRRPEPPSTLLLSDTIGDDEIWACTTCMACVTHCPVSIRPMDKVLEMRRDRVLNLGALPTEAIAAMRNLELYGDVNGKGTAHRQDWALNGTASAFPAACCGVSERIKNKPKSLPGRFPVACDGESFNHKVPRITAGRPAPDLLLWVGCSGAFHPDNQETTRAMVKLLRAADVSFAILGQEELCCGDPARKLGNEALFKELARKNIATFKACGIGRIVTLCPHCFNTLGREYAALGFEAEVVHAAELVAQWIDQDRIHLKYPYHGAVAFHDPCYLGRYNGIYEPLRRIGRAVPGITLREPVRNREKGFCCGAGGGRMWLHENLGEKINHVRARELAATGAGTLATACPYCLIMMADGVAALETEKKPKVVDIIRLAAEAIG